MTLSHDDSTINIDLSYYYYYYYYCVLGVAQRPTGFVVVFRVVNCKDEEVELHSSVECKVGTII